MQSQISVTEDSRSYGVLVIEYTDIGETINWKPLDLRQEGNSALQLINMDIR